MNNDTMNAAVTAFLNLDTRRSVCSIAYTGADAVHWAHPERSDLARIADEYGVSRLEFRNFLTAACRAMHEAECGSWAQCKGQH
jgi:hypothetical protein